MVSKMSVCIEEQAISVDDVCKIASKILDLPKVEPEDNLFELGMNSIRAIMFIGKIKKQAGIKDISLTMLFEEPTPNSFTDHLNAACISASHHL